MRKKLPQLLFLPLIGIFIVFSVQSQDLQLKPISDASITYQYPDSTLTKSPGGNNLFAYWWEEDIAIAFMQFDISEYKGLTVANAEISTRAMQSMGSDNYMLELYGTGATEMSSQIAPYEDASVTSLYPDSAGLAYMANKSNLFAYEWEEDKAIAYLKFDLSQFAGKTITGADLSIRAQQRLGSDEYYLALFGTYSSWTDDSLKWNNRPALSPDTLAIRQLTVNADRASFVSRGQALVDYLNDKIESGENMISFAIESFGADTARGHFEYFGDEYGMWIGSEENGSWGPYLTITTGVDNVTWNNHPEILDPKLASRLLTDNPERVAFNNAGNELINYVNEKLSKGAETITFAILSNGTDTARGHSEIHGEEYGMWIGSVEDGGYEPYMSLSIMSPVAAPVISPDGESITDKTAISITSETEGATIFYTIDGSDPDETSNQYMGEFELNEAGNVVVKAIAYSDNMTPSEITTVTYSITVGIEVLNRGKISLYPNPTSGKVHLQLNEVISGNFTININDITGRVVKIIKLEDTVNSENYHLDISDLKQGIYLFSFKVGSKKYIERVVIK